VSASYSAKVQAWNDRVLTVPANRADLQIRLHPASHRVFTGARKWNEGSIPLVFREERRREMYCTNEACKRPGVRQSLVPNYSFLGFEACLFTLVLGLTNGALVAFLRLSPFIETLGH
jgi:hypothetical protein